MARPNRFYKRYVLALLSGSAILGMAGCSAQQLKTNTADMAKTYPEVVQDEILDNLAWMDQGHPDAVPAFVSVTGGTAQLTDQIMAGVSATITSHPELAAGGATGTPSASAYRQSGYTWTIVAVNDQVTLDRLDALLLIAAKQFPQWTPMRPVAYSAEAEEAESTSTGPAESADTKPAATKPINQMRSFLNIDIKHNPLEAQDNKNTWPGSNDSASQKTKFGIIFQLPYSLDSQGHPILMNPQPVRAAVPGYQGQSSTQVQTVETQAATVTQPATTKTTTKTTQAPPAPGVVAGWQGVMPSRSVLAFYEEVEDLHDWYKTDAIGSCKPDGAIDGGIHRSRQIWITNPMKFHRFTMYVLAILEAQSQTGATSPVGIQLINPQPSPSLR